MIYGQEELAQTPVLVTNNILKNADDKELANYAYDTEWVVVLIGKVSPPSEDAFLKMMELSGKLDSFGAKQWVEFVVLSDDEQMQADDILGKGERLLWDETGRYESSDTPFKHNDFGRRRLGNIGDDDMLVPMFSDELDDEHANLVSLAISYDIASRMRWNGLVPSDAYDPNSNMLDSDVYDLYISSITYGHNKVTLDRIALVAGAEMECDFEWRIMDYSSAAYALAKAGLAGDDVEKLAGTWSDVMMFRKLWETNDEDKSLRDIIAESWENELPLSVFARQHCIDIKLQLLKDGVPLEDILA